MSGHSPMPSLPTAITAAFVLFTSAPLTAQIAAVPPAPVERLPLVNAPVAPEALYVLSAVPAGVRILDLNGFGQGTGDPRRTRFPLNPNVGRTGVQPPLTPGTTSVDTGGAGAATLTQNSWLGTQLLPGSAARSIVDAHLGHPLDLLYNNFGINRSAGGPNQINPMLGIAQAGNTITVAPHPNPPRLVFPVPNPSMNIGGEEPSVTTSGPFGPRTTTLSPPCMPSPRNALEVGNPFSTSPVSRGIFGTAFDRIFVGPQPPPSRGQPIPFCPFTSRQQIGHFLYLVDVVSDRVIVVNSNRMTVLANIRIPQPGSAAMHPNLKVLAVTSTTQNEVHFIDTDPLSRNFHQVVAVTRVGNNPTGLAWQPEGEELLVCNRGDNTVSILNGVAFNIRKTLRTSINRPQEVAVSARQERIGLDTKTWFAWILNGDGSIAVYESGPTARGPDRVIGATARFAAARTLRVDASRLRPSVWVTHRDSAGLGQVSRVEISVGSSGQRVFSTAQRIGGMTGGPVRDLLSGNVITDVAFDDNINLGALSDMRSAYVNGVNYAPHSGKGIAKTFRGSVFAAKRPKFAFVACADVGKVDMIDLATSRKLLTIDALGVTSLVDYWRQ